MRFRLPPLKRRVSLGQVEFFQVTLKVLPPLLRALGAAFVSLLPTIVISFALKEEMVPVLLAVETEELLFVQTLNLGSGTIEPLLVGASAIHSALEFLQLLQVSVLVKLLPVWVESVSLSVYLVPLRVTKAAILSPTLTFALTTWMELVGYISHQL